MTVKQLSVFIENKPGTMVNITNALGKANVDIRAMSLADTQDFGILRLMVSDTEKARVSLSEIGCITSVTEVIAAAVPDTPGAMTEMIKLLSENEINIEYMYAFVAPDDNHAYVVFRVYKKPGKGQSCRKFWSDSPAIPETFVPCHSFASNLVGPSAVHASRVECAMEIDHQLVFRSQTHDFLVPVHHLLVLSVHEIYFESLHTTL